MTGHEIPIVVHISYSLFKSVGQSLLLRADGLVFELGFRRLAVFVSFLFIICFRLLLSRHAIHHQSLRITCLTLVASVNVMLPSLTKLVTY